MSVPGAVILGFGRTMRLRGIWSHSGRRPTVAWSSFALSRATRLLASQAIRYGGGSTTIRLRIPLFALSVATSICAFAAQGISYVSLPFLFEETLGKSQVVTGLLMTPWPLTVAVIAPISGRLSDRYPAGILGGAGLAIMALGLASVALLPPHPSNLDVAWRMVICGLGFGFFNTPNNRAIITTAPRSRSGGASGMQATSRLLGQTFGAALVALVFGLFPVNGTIITLVIAACTAAAASAVSLTRLLDRGRAAGIE
jgi:MFS transporter, DHA2 family, multidrug resistance protein